MAEAGEDQPLELGITTPRQSPSPRTSYFSKLPVDSPHSNSSSPPPHVYGFGQTPLSSHSYLSPVASPRSLTSSRTSIAIGSSGRNHINVGIGLGTTFSGVAWTISGPNPKIRTVTSWPDMPSNNTNMKVPSAILYNKDGSVSWGYSVAPDAEALRWFKLLLRAEDDLPLKVRQASQLKAARKLLQKLNKSATEVLANYLEQLWNCTWTELGRALQSRRDTMPFRIVMTVPAKWPEEIRGEMRKAAETAGLLRRRGGQETKLEFVEEPEAAALSSFLDDDISLGRSRGDVILICDAGGGTADVVTYKLESTGPPVQLGEHMGGEADLCGSMFIDEEFVKYIEELIGKERLAKMSKRVFNEMIEAWEFGLKRKYETNTRELVPTLPHDIAKAIKSRKNPFKKSKGRKQVEGDTMRFPGEDIAKMFNPVMESLVSLILEQITSTMQNRRSKADAILLVGGLGSNLFLHQRLKAQFHQKDIEILQPKGPDAWAAVCRGAAIKGATFDEYDGQVMPVVTSYISRAHYGIVNKVPFDESIHSDIDKKFDAATNQWLAYNQMHWYASKNDDLRRSDPKTHSWQRFQPDSQPCTNFTIKIYEAQADIAPSRLEPGAVRECESIVIPVVWSNLAIIESSSGEKFRRAQFELKMTTSGLEKLDFTTYVDGVEVAQRKVTVKTSDAPASPRSSWRG